MNKHLSRAVLEITAECDGHELCMDCPLSVPDAAGTARCGFEQGETPSQWEDLIIKALVAANLSLAEGGGSGCAADDGWTPVDKGMPDYFREVQVWGPELGDVTTSMRLRIDDVFSIEDPYDRKVTHWRPLSDPPPAGGMQNVQGPSQTASARDDRGGEEEIGERRSGHE